MIAVADMGQQRVSPEDAPAAHELSAPEWFYYRLRDTA